MTTTATMLADSLHPNGSRLCTLELHFPMYVQPQLLRHRAFSFSVQSTRAVPLKEQIKRVRENPYVPTRWGAAQKGMVAERELDEVQGDQAESAWMTGAKHTAEIADWLLTLNVHQEVAARLLMPFQWCRMIVSATEWDNFFALRIDPHAQAEIRVLAEAIRDAMQASTPTRLAFGAWHLPLVDAEDGAWVAAESQHGTTEDAWRLLRLISAGRCARVSFLQHDGRRGTPRDAKLGERLVLDGHMSPLEHQASPTHEEGLHGNFAPGWLQHRKLYANESDRSKWT